MTNMTETRYFSPKDDDDSDTYWIILGSLVTVVAIVIAVVIIIFVKVFKIFKTRQESITSNIAASFRRRGFTSSWRQPDTSVIVTSEEVNLYAASWRMNSNEINVRNSGNEHPERVDNQHGNTYSSHPQTPHGNSYTYHSQIYSGEDQIYNLNNQANSVNNYVYERDNHGHKSDSYINIVDVDAADEKSIYINTTNLATQYIAANTNPYDYLPNGSKPRKTSNDCRVELPVSVDKAATASQPIYDYPRENTQVKKDQIYNLNIQANSDNNSVYEWDDHGYNNDRYINIADVDTDTDDEKSIYINTTNLATQYIAANTNPYDYLPNGSKPIKTSNDCRVELPVSVDKAATASQPIYDYPRENTQVVQAESNYDDSSQGSRPARPSRTMVNDQEINNAPPRPPKPVRYYPRENAQVVQAESNYDYPRENAQVVQAESNYDYPRENAQVVQAESNYDYPRENAQVVQAESNYDYPRENAQVVQAESNYDYPRENAQVVQAESNYDYPRENAVVQAESNYDYPRENTQLVQAESNYDYPRQNAQVVQAESNYDYPRQNAQVVQAESNYDDSSQGSRPARPSRTMVNDQEINNAPPRPPKPVRY
ncbi:uncharacterized protein LOC121868825 [Homarus americanus]|uniref:uncharacterized protein LOC121868825 n=1 Tax=Homarus americanus TaxID=6706 RepID=UPI001C45AD28|nr:uncharacterized protein LOC121868825 [Homarus americanus]